MNKRFEIEKFSARNVDELLSLRPPRLLIASLIFLCRSLVAVVALRLAGAGLQTLVGDIDTQGIWIRCLAALPALLLLYGVGSRVPTAPAFVRWAWTHGRALVSVSALCHIVLTTTLYWSQPRLWHETSLVEKSFLLVDAAIIGYVFVSARVRLTFLDFPSTKA